MSDLNLGKEYVAVAHAFGYTWDDMVQVSLDGVEACWLDESDKADLQRHVVERAESLAPRSSGEPAI